MASIYKNFISFEGIDFCGKSTQIRALLPRLLAKGIKAEVMREPGGTEISEKIREILLSPVHGEMVDRTEILLYEAARSQLVHQKILPLLKNGVYIIADRYYDSTTAYQGFGRGLEMAVVDTLNQFATSGLKPFRTFFIDISPEEARRRQMQNGHAVDRLESGGVEFFERVRNGFLEMCRNEPKRFVQINGEQEAAKVEKDIWKVLTGLWPVQD